MTRHRRAVARVVTSGFLLAMLAACAHKASAPFVKDDLVQLTATVTAVEPSAGLVSLRGPDGEATVSVPPDLRNIENVQVGDRVSVSYYKGIAAQIKRHGTTHAGFESVVAEASAPEGARPARAIGQTLATTVTIESVDTSFHTVTFRRADGFVRVLAVESPEGRAYIRKLSHGDEVDVIYTEAVAVEVAPAR
jgi:hypothetical protein